ncbi:MAG: hypothetical protein QM778_02655 [Myxococcales bacterium]
MAPELLALEGDFGVGSLVALPVLTSGTLTLHARPSQSPDGGVPVGDAGHADGGTSLDAGLTAADCARHTRLAALRLGVNPSPTSPAVDGGLSADAGVDPEKTTLIGPGPLMLIASGLALDEKRLATRFDEERTAYLGAHPGDTSGAEQKAREVVAGIESAIGPQLRIEPPVTESIPSDAFRISVSQLSPDVSGSMSMVGPGGVRVCVTAGSLVNPVQPPLRADGIAFRDTQTLAPLFKPLQSGSNYRIRVFASTKFEQPNMLNSGTAQDCATTSLTPLADLNVAGKSFVGGRPYSLLLTGAVALSAVCAPVDDRSVVRAGCPGKPDDLVAKLQLLDPQASP